MTTERIDYELTEAQSLLLISQLKRLKEIAGSLATTYEEILLHPASEVADSFKALADAALSKAMTTD
ncbi:hypothetical protein [Herbaspirillum rubrisubalbicans]|uniref:Uncharacterized protein n=1 Tax=Herbaspirillum rubrisubalbicans Os34 TaxID=1235827 RepID=A0A6M3ZYB6_9BURK|nr:hypothetical protein [Herbaspirillum rubrisubalbicans]QJQ02512.1 hypothetical protein C798_20465 [Herbaspirillum rubrisubalbicans Os34]